jgi:transcriptional regulator with GAF, ATPase, and Fis domain
MASSPDSGDTRTLIRDASGWKLRTRKLRVEIVEGPDRGRVSDLSGADARVGTGKSCDLVLADDTVSRHHFSLRVEDAGIRVLDAGSRNGTTIDGLRVRDAWARSSSLIVAGATTLRVRLLDDMIDLPLSPRDHFGGLVGASVAMRQMFALLEKVAPSEATVLLEGETGTGKELAAEALHEESPRSAGPFVVLDCSAISASLIESELFGHIRGAFTGATADRAGALEAADGGTIFLDEIGELPLDLQPKLLRALERREVRRVGANDFQRVDIRVVAATNRSLAAEVDAGRFREDLYYRLAVVTVALPPLRERPDDIALLARRFAADIGRGATLSPRALRAFESQAWPGNVRELRNAVARALSLGEPSGEPAAAPPVPAGAVDLSVPLVVARDRLVDGFEERYLREALRQTGGNVTRAAEIAGVNRKFIQRAVKRYNLRDDE